MKVLTVTEPWASLLVWGEKRYETRHWAPKAVQPGDLFAIHAAKGMSKDVRWFTDRQPEIVRILKERNVGLDYFDNVTRGHIIGIVKLLGFSQMRDFPDDPGDVHLVGKGKIIRPSAKERALGDWEKGRIAWEVEPAERIYERIPHRGLQAWSEWDGSTSTFRSSVHRDWRWLPPPAAIDEGYWLRRDGCSMSQDMNGQADVWGPSPNNDPIGMIWHDSTGWVVRSYANEPLPYSGGLQTAWMAANYLLASEGYPCPG